MQRAFAPHLAEGERLLWVARPTLPRALRRLGVPPRRPAHVLLWAAALTLLTGLVLGGIDSGRAGLAAAGAAPLALLAAALLGGLWRRRRVAYGLTDRRRFLIRRGREVQAFTLPERVDLDPGEAGALTCGVEVEARVLAGPRAGATVRLSGRVPDVPYPPSLAPLLGAARSPSQRP